MAQTSSQFLWKIGAPAGLGVLTTGLTLSKLAIRSGHHVFEYAEYPSLIKGGHNTCEVNLSSEPVTASKRPVDCLVCFDKLTFDLHKDRLHDQSLVLYDPNLFEPETTAKKIPIPFQQLMDQLKAEKIMINMIGLGASFALLGGDHAILNQLIIDQFKSKGDVVVELNTACEKIGFDYITEHFASEVKPILASQPTVEPRVVLTANETFALGAIASDCKFFAAYPMSPSTGVLETLAALQQKTGMVVRHAEDEIGVVNEVLGASFAGVRACTASSGGGFALMVESLSYAGVAEIPLVVYVAQRPGPATGMPTWTEQGDLLFSVFAGHGEFPKIVLAPGDPAEMLELGAQAFDLAEIYQTPVIVLSDKVLCESHLDFPKAAMEKLLQHTPDHGKTISHVHTQPYHRYEVTADGISPRLIPGVKGAFYQANSYEHIPDSHTTEDSQPRIEQVDKRNRKVVTYFEKHFKLPTVFGDLQAADTVLVSWGGNKGAILEALKQANSQGKKVAYVHFTHVFPLHRDKLLPFLNLPKRYVLVENNSTGQLGHLLKMETGFEPAQKLLKYDGRPIYVEEVVAAIG